MPGQDFTVSMILRAVNQMTPVIQKTATELKQLQSQINQVNKLLNASSKQTWLDNAITGATKLSSKLKTAQESMDKLVKSGEKSLLTGSIMALPLVGAIKSAANVQRTQTSLELSGLSSSQVNTLTTQAQQTMRKTMFGTGDVLGIDLALSQVGMNYQKMQNVGTNATYLAELEANRNGADPQTTAKQFAQMAEQLQISTDPKKVNQLADQVNRISTVTSASVATLADSSRYFNLVGTIQGLTPSDIMLTQGLAARYGLEGSIGGTNLKDFFERLNPQLHMNTMMGKPIVNAFASMGWLKGVKYDKKGNVAGISGDVFHDSKGNLVGADQIFSIIAKTYQQMGNKEQFNALMTRIFGQQGQAIASAVAQNPQYFGMLQQQMSKVPTVNQSITKFQGTFNQQFKSFISTLADFGRQVGTMLLPSLTADIKQLNAELPKLQTFIDKHKQLIKTLAEVWGGLAAFKIASGVAKIAVGAPARELFGVARGGVDMVKGGLKLTRDVRNAAKTYASLRKGGHFNAITGALSASSNVPFSAIGKGLKKMEPMLKMYAKFSGWSTMASGVQRFGSMIGRVGPKVLEITRLTKAWRLAQLALNFVMDTNPIALIIMGIVAAVGVLAVGITELVIHWKTVVNWLKTALNWFKHLGAGVQVAIAIFMPFIGLPALIIAHWKPIAQFFEGIGKSIGGVVQHLFGGGTSTPVVAGAGAGGGQMSIANHYYISSTDPKGVASEVNNTQQKYINSRYPINRIK